MRQKYSQYLYVYYELFKSFPEKKRHPAKFTKQENKNAFMQIKIEPFYLSLEINL